MKILLRTVILTIVRLLGIPGNIRTHHHRQQSGAPRILLLRPDHLGDMVMTTPVLQALRDQLPNTHITMMIGPWSSEVVARHPAIDQLITCPFPGFQRAPQKPLDPYKQLLRTAQQLRRCHYDLAINLRPDFWWGAALLYLACIPHRIGYAIKPSATFLTRALPFPPAEHAAVSSLRLLDAALQATGHTGLQQPYTPTCYPLAFTPTDEEQQWVSQRLEAASITNSTPIVVIHPGTGGAVKLWRNAAWSRIADDLSTTKLLPQPAQIVLTGSKQERPMLEAIASAMTHKPLLVTDATVGQLAALLARAQLVLGVDNGPLHLATAQDTLTIVLFGPTDPRIFGPWGTASRHLVIASTQRCPTCPTIPCGRLDFRPDELPDHPCVRVITEQQLEQAIVQLLDETHQPGLL